MLWNHTFSESFSSLTELNIPGYNFIQYLRWELKMSYPFGSIGFKLIQGYKHIYIPD